MEDKLQVIREKIFMILACCLVFFHVYTAVFGMFEAVQQRSLCLSLILVMIYITNPCKIKKAGPLIDIIFIVMSVAATAHIFADWDGIVMRAGVFRTYEVVYATMFMIALAEASRRKLGWALTIIAGVAMLYNMFGSKIPIFNLGFRRIKYGRIAYNMVYTTEGIFSVPFGSVATFVIVFLLFAEIMDATGAREFLMDFALMIFGKKRGGPAKVAVISSGLFGMISGSSVANVVSTGCITIPLMKRSGFESKVAGAVEACASTGGMLAPPIMGATAFVMSEVLGVSYLHVLKSAIIPAIMYYAAIYLYIEFKTMDGRSTYKVREEDLGVKDVDKKLVAKKLLIVFVPIGLLIALMNKFSVQKACMTSAFVMIILAIILRSSDGLKHPVEICRKTARSAQSVAMSTALGGVVVGVLNFTGLGFKISNLLISASGDSRVLLCVLAMLASIVFGMGLPPTACYILVATLVAPVMVSRGITMMAAHLFALYFGILSNITPPVATASYAAAPIAQESPMKVGWAGFIIMLDLCLVPYGFVYYPGLLLLEDATLMSVVTGIVTISITIILGAVALAGYYFHVKLSIIERVILMAVTLIVFNPAVPLVGNIALFVIVTAVYMIRGRKNKVNDNLSGAV